MLLYINGLDFFDRTTVITNGAKFENWKGDDSTELSISDQFSRTSGSGIRLVTNSRTSGLRGSVTVHLQGNYETLIVGAAIRLDSNNTGSGLESVNHSENVILFSFMDEDEEQVSVVFTPSMRIAVVNDTRGTTLARSTQFFHHGVYYYIEFESLISNTVGTYRVRVDGNQILSGTGDTQVSTGQYANGVRFGITKVEGSINAGRFIKYDDIYIAANVVATDYNDFVGDIRVEGLRASGELPKHEWEPTSGTLHYDMIDDTAPDTANILSCGTVGNTSVFAYPNPSTPLGSILAISPNIYARKNQAGVARVAAVVNSGNQFTVGTDNYLTQEYQYHYPDVWVKHPASNSQWPFVLAGTIGFGIRRTG